MKIRKTPYLLSLFFVLFSLTAHAQDGIHPSESPETEPKNVEKLENWDFELDMPDVDVSPLPKVELKLPEKTNGSNGELQTFLSEGKTAPFAGILLTTEAMAFILAQHEALVQRARAALKQQRTKDQARLMLEVQRRELEIESIRKQHKVEKEALQNQIDSFQEINEDLRNELKTPKWKSFLQIGGSVILGVAVGLVSGVVIAK